MPKLLLLNSPKKKFVLLSVLLIASGIILFFFPLVLSIDSVYGFLAYKGTLSTHYFNVISSVAPHNISTTENTFVSWWSPGQWMFPAFINYFTGVRTGIACVIITIAANCVGLIGYYRLFTYFQFSPVIVSLSLLAILCSSTFYYNYFIYQGGEILSFGIFPWFSLYVLRLKRIAASSTICIIIFFLLCFIAKSTLIVYCTLVLIAKGIQQFSPKTNNVSPVYHWKSILYLAFSGGLSIALIYFFYLSKGHTPISDKSSQFHLRLPDILTPLSSPFLSILSVQEWLARSNRIALLRNGQNYFAAHLIYIVSLALTVVTMLFGNIIYRSKLIHNGYKACLFCIWGGTFIFFFLSYAFDARIGYDARHYKLLGYLFVPAMLTTVNNRIRSWHMHFIVFMFVLLAVSDFIYLKNKWKTNRYVSKNYFYRHFDKLTDMDYLSLSAYNKLISIDSSNKNNKPDATIFVIEADADVAIDIKQPAIMISPEKDFLADVYLGKGPELIICVSKKTIMLAKDALKIKFPDYTNFELTDEIDGYLFFFRKKLVFFRTF